MTDMYIDTPNVKISQRFAEKTGMISADSLPKLLDELEMAAVAYLEDPSTRKTRLIPAREAVESYVETLRHIGRTTREMYDQAESALASLKEQQLTRAEATAVLDFYDTGNDWRKTLPSALAKLRLLSTSDSEQQ